MAAVYTHHREGSAFIPAAAGVGSSSSNAGSDTNRIGRPALVMMGDY